MIKWNEVYNGLAKLLSTFYKIHKNNSGYELYKICTKDLEFVELNKWIIKFEDEFDTPSIDPIHIFMSINEYKINKDKRLDRINTLFMILGENKSYSAIDFSGCPSPFALKIMSARTFETQKEIWDIFYEIIVNNQRALNQRIFDRLHYWYGIDISAFTIFLFWIDATSFLPLDKNTVKFLLSSNKIKIKPKSYEDYRRLLIGANTNLYLEIASISFQFSEKGRGTPRYSKQLNRYLNNKISKITDFKIIAIRPLKDINIKFRKVLKYDIDYIFCNAYDLTDSNNIKYNKYKDLKIYKTSDVEINICAIVGKNGSGKSSLTELLYLAINNLSSMIMQPNDDLIFVEGLFLELFFITNNLYKISYNNQVISIFEYEFKNGVYTNPKPIKLSKYQLEQFFYSIAINYSHYALNSLEQRNWIQKLFHKNDGYQIPIVLNPMRTEGNIDINLENYFVKNRLLANILEPVSLDDKRINQRYLTDTRFANRLELTINRNKIKFLYDDVRFSALKNYDILIRKVFEVFNIVIDHNKHNELAEKYIIRKIVNIAIKYKPYKNLNYFDKKNNKFYESKIDKYLDDLFTDKSHVTFKLWQAINFLKYDIIDKNKQKQEIDINELSNKILKEKIRFQGTNSLETIELIPPSFYNIEIILDDDSNFDDLSSGEKQKIHTVSSIIYHLRNLDSISNNALINYLSVNIIFDEVELYFHPDMQRSFVNYFLKYIERVELSNITNINCLFVTHSPFILSDIISNNIVFLSENGLPRNDLKDTQTFGANIHNLLVNSFFLNDIFIGEFARNKIQKIIDNLQIDTVNVDSETLMTKSEIIEIINLIGEPFLKDKLLEMYYVKFPDEYELESEIQELKIKLKKLEDGKNRIER